MRNDVRDRLGPAETDANIDQHRDDTHEGAVQDGPVLCFPRDPNAEEERCNERRWRGGVLTVVGS